MRQTEDEHRLVDSGLEPIESEEADLDATPASYEIVTYPADFTLEGLVPKIQRGQIKIPGFQRKFVWSLPQASKLIESFLLGLPVPAVFLYTDPKDNSLLVIDGQQRLLSVKYYFEGFFGPPEKGRSTVFALKGLNEKSPYRDKTYAELKDMDEAAYNRLNDSVLRAFVVKQLNPKDHTSVHHVFERLNTGGTQLVSQEIRNCIYHGPFNDTLGSLNTDENWRAIYGRKAEDKRGRDVELILRFLALLYDSAKYKKPMKDFLSDFMHEHRSASDQTLAKYRRSFVETCDAVRKHLGAKPFHIRAGLNAAVFDSVFVAFGKSRGTIPKDILTRYKRLVQDDVFTGAVSQGTTDEEVVARRLKLAREKLFG